MSEAHRCPGWNNPGWKNCSRSVSRCGAVGAGEAITVPCACYDRHHSRRQRGTHNLSSAGKREKEGEREREREREIERKRELKTIYNLRKESPSNNIMTIWLCLSIMFFFCLVRCGRCVHERYARKRKRTCVCPAVRWEGEVMFQPFICQTLPLISCEVCPSAISFARHPSVGKAHNDSTTTHCYASETQREHTQRERERGRGACEVRKLEIPRATELSVSETCAPGCH